MYLIAFIVGLGFLILSLFIGNWTEIEGTALSLLRPTLIAVFLSVTGGLGMIFSARMDGPLSEIIVAGISIAAGIVVAGMINRFLIVPLYKAQSTSAFHKQDTIGVAAQVIARIPQGGYGKIKFNISGSVVTSPAKSEDSNEIRSGENVEILYIEGNTYYVRRSQT